LCKLKAIPKQIVILGGGASIKDGLNMGLFNTIQDSWTLGLNYSYKWFTSTTQCFVDGKVFYEKNLTELKRLKQVVGFDHPDASTPKKQHGMDNTMLLKCISNGYDRSLKKGVYTAFLVGLFALSFAIWLLDEGEIFLLGYDWGTPKPKEGELQLNGDLMEDVTDIVLDKKIKLNKNYIRTSANQIYRPITHWYQKDFTHRGTGRLHPYGKNRAKALFKHYEAEKKVKIYNVSMDSNIPTFPKITYDEFFNRVNKTHYCDDFLRNYTKVRILKDLK